MRNILITGVGSGLGKALAQTYLEKGDKVYAIGRTFPKAFDHSSLFFFFPYDLNETFMLKESLKAFIKGHTFDIVILNAGILGEIKILQQTNLEEIKRVMELNVWANKELIDTLIENATVKQIVGISSGAGVHGSKGWGAYALSKAALNMLVNIYAKEVPQIHFAALAPGVIDTPMIHQIIDYVDAKEFPSVERLKNGPIQKAEDAAKLLVNTFDELLKYESGSFIDIRKIP